jgi:hypothetical protein
VVGVLRRSGRALLAVQVVVGLPGLLVAGALQHVPGLGPSASLLLTVAAVVVAAVAGLAAQVASFPVAVGAAVGRPVGVRAAVRGALRLEVVLHGVFAAVLPVTGSLLLGRLFVPVAAYLVVVYAAALAGCVAAERAGVTRAVGLATRHLGVVTGRALVVAAVVLVWAGLLGVVVTAVAPAGSVVATLLVAVLALPVTTLLAAVAVVSYAELRHRADPAVDAAALAERVGV